MCQLDIKPNLVFVHKSPDSSRNLTGKQNYQAGKELLERNKKRICTAYGQESVQDPKLTIQLKG